MSNNKNKNKNARKVNLFKENLKLKSSTMNKIIH